MARTPQSFEKRQRERAKQQRREQKMEARLIRNEEKRLGESGGGAPHVENEVEEDFGLDKVPDPRLPPDEDEE